MKTYNWQINQMDRLTSDGFVVIVHYSVVAIDGDYTANTYGTVNFTEQPNAQLIPYEDLTPEIVIKWVQNSLDQETIESSLDAQIYAQKNPVQKSGLPWLPDPVKAE